MLYKHELYVEDIDRIVSYPMPWERLDGKRIFITGATGMIGTVLIDALMRRNEKFGSGIKVYAMARNPERAHKRFADYTNDENFTFVKGDINKPIEHAPEFDFIFHCASNTHPKDYSADPIGTIMTNVTGTKNVLDYVVSSGAERAVFLSSVEIYGENRGDTERFSENYCGFIDCNTMRAGYPEGKRAGEALCQAYIAKYGIDVVIPRVSRVYGPSMLMTDSKALSQFIKKAVAGEDIVLKSEGMQYYSYSYAADVACALIFLLLKGENGQAYNIADPSSDVRLREIAGLLAEQAGKKVVFELPDEAERRGYSTATKALLDPLKINNLGWRPNYDIKGGVCRTVKILRENGELGQ